MGGVRAQMQLFLDSLGQFFMFFGHFFSVPKKYVGKYVGEEK